MEPRDEERRNHMALADRAIALNRIKDGLSGQLTVKQLDSVMSVIQSTLNIFKVEMTDGNTSNTGYKEWLEAYLNALQVEGKKKGTIRHHRYIISKFFDTVNLGADAINAYHVRKYMSDMKDGGCSDSYIANIRATLMPFFEWLHNEELIRTNPCKNISKIKTPAIVRLPYAKTDLEIMYKACENLRDLALIHFLRATGCRIAETCALNREDIDFQNHECIVFGKGSKERTVFLDDVAIMYLQKYLDSRTDNNEALFGGRHTKRMKPGSIRAMMAKLSKKTGIENIHPHRFRRTFATNMIERGMPIEDVAKIMGHADISTTMKYVYQSKAKIKAEYKKYTA